MTLGEIAAATGGTCSDGSVDARVDGFSIDTRSLQAGDVFFALRGPRFDGHAFVDEALSRGASGVVVEVGWAESRANADTATPVRVVVPDSLAALQRLAWTIRRESGTRVVAITGSAGKTTTKEMAATVVSRAYRVFRNAGNLNNEIGLPLSLLELRHRPEVAIVELGMNHPGEISRLVEIAEPDVRVWTNVADAHLGFFPSVEAIADAKAEVFDGARGDSLLVANANDPRVMARTPRFRGRLVTFGIDMDADVMATDVHDRGRDGTTAVIRAEGGEFELTVPLLGRMNLSNALAATSLGLHFGVAREEIAAAVASCRPASHRGVIVRLRDDITVVDDSYNSNPTALREMLDSLQRLGGARRVAVLGEMLELGDRAMELHAAMGRAVVAAGVELLVTVGGPPADALAQEAVATGLPAASVSSVETSEEAADVVSTLVRSGDLVLVKGSRGIRTDVVVGRLQERFR